MSLVISLCLKCFSDSPGMWSKTHTPPYVSSSPSQNSSLNVCARSLFHICLYTQVQLWVGKISWRRKWQPPPVLLPGKSHGRRSLVGHSPWGHKESDPSEGLNFLSSFHWLQGLGIFGDYHLDYLIVLKSKVGIFSDLSQLCNSMVRLLER